MQTLTSPQSPPASAPPPTPRRRRRWPIVLAVLLVLFTGLLVIADRVVASIAEDQLVEVATDAAARYDTESAETSISLQGFPFLTQVLGGTFDGATIKMRDITIGATPAERATITLTGVQVPREVIFGEAAHDIVAERVNGKVRMSPESVAELANASGAVTDFTLSAAGDKLKATLPVFYAGVTTTVSGIVTPEIRDGAVGLIVETLTASDGELPEGIQSVVNGQLGNIPVPELPFGLSLTDVDVDGGDIVLAAKARNVVLVE